MMAIPHIGFILAAYGVTAVTMGGLVATVLLDRHALKRDLARLETRGHGRRADAAPRRDGLPR